jgi:hypothetical protein
MQDLGNLYGATAQANGINSQGWVVGLTARVDTLTVTCGTQEALFSMSGAWV